jgi:hypothetical protein
MSRLGDYQKKNKKISRLRDFIEPIDISNSEDSVLIIDISQYRLLFGFFLLYMDRIPFELLDSAALL